MRPEHTLPERGSGIDKGKERITKFFKENHTLQEKANFLKDEYGTFNSDTAAFTKAA